MELSRKSFQIVTEDTTLVDVRIVRADDRWRLEVVVGRTTFLPVGEARMTEGEAFAEGVTFLVRENLLVDEWERIPRGRVGAKP